MNKAKKPFLISPLHDPEERYLSIVKKWASLLSNFYSLIIIGVSQKTNLKVLTKLKNLGFIIRQGDYSYGQGYRQALTYGLKRGGQTFLCSDFDRIIHWISSYPKELQKTLKKAHTAKSKEQSFSMLAEWPLLVKKEIKKIDYQKWLENYDDTRKWKKKTRDYQSNSQVILKYD